LQERVYPAVIAGFVRSHGTFGISVVAVLPVVASVDLRRCIVTPLPDLVLPVFISEDRVVVARRVVLFGFSDTEVLLVTC
jgi:hypothetical protein